MPVELTDLEIARATQGVRARARVELSDAVVPGLRLRATRASATWSVLVLTDGSWTRTELGRWPEVSLADARREAGLIRAGAEMAAQPGHGSKPTVGELLKEYRERRLLQLRRGEGAFRSLQSGLEPVLGKTCDAIARRDLSVAINKVADRAPAQANRTLAYAKAFFNWAVGQGHLDASPAASIPKPTREVARERTPSLRELVAIWDGAGTLGYPFAHAIQLLILTGSRRTEIGEIRVAELELPRSELHGCWVIPGSRSKNRRALRVPLSPLARQIVEDALVARPPGSDFLFSTNGKSPISGWSRAKQRLDIQVQNWASELEMEGWRLHDLRRSFATLACEELNAPIQLVDRCLNHVGASTTSTVTRVYARSELYDQRRDLLESWAELLIIELGLHSQLSGGDPLANLQAKAAAMAAGEVTYQALASTSGHFGRSPWRQALPAGVIDRNV